jgi:hypothetical protein
MAGLVEEQREVLAHRVAIEIGGRGAQQCCVLGEQIERGSGSVRRWRTRLGHQHVVARTSGDLGDPGVQKLNSPGWLRRGTLGP